MIGLDKKMVMGHKQSDAGHDAGVRQMINRISAIGIMAGGAGFQKEAPDHAAVLQDSKNAKERWD